jgi:hypothetical protein
MRIIAILTLIALVSPMLAMPDDRSTNNTVCKIYIDTGESVVCYYAWQNPATTQWEVEWGIVTYKGVTTSQEPSYGNYQGIVKLEMT